MGARGFNILANLDLVVLAIALPVFLLAELPMLGFAVAATVWLIQRLVLLLAERKAREDLAEGNRNRAMGMVAASGLGRAWAMSLVVLLTGVVEREAGLWSAVLLVVLFTLNLGTRALVHLLEADEAPS